MRSSEFEKKRESGGKEASEGSTGKAKGESVIVFGGARFRRRTTRDGALRSFLEPDSQGRILEIFKRLRKRKNFETKVGKMKKWLEAARFLFSR